MLQPNMRLKLAGAARLSGSGWSVCALAGTAGRPLLLRRRAGRPQLKRDPLGRSVKDSMAGVLSLWLLWPVLLPLTVAAALLAAVAVRRHSLPLVSFGAIGLLVAMALYGFVEVLATTLLALFCVSQAWKPIKAAVVCFTIGVLVMPVGTLAHLLTTCFFAKECV